MLKYNLAALALKAFSINATTKRVYRRIGNRIGGRLRSEGHLDYAYLERGKLLVDLFARYENLTESDRLLELGTGWMHWYSIYLRLVYACRFATLDIWDNRQFDALQACVSKLPQSELRDEILGTRSFDELYDLLGFEHFIIPDGMLTQFEDESFTSVFSMHVLEHVPRSTIRAVINDMYRIMKPNHHTIHQIGIDDHLAHYDSSASAKRYLRYSKRAWSAFYENSVQYQNRLQPSDFVAMFEDAGFELIHREQENADISHVPVNKEFRHYPQDDLACSILTLVLRK